MGINEYMITGRKKCTDSDVHPKIYKMKLFATNPVVARSKFWYFMSQQHKVKRVNGEILGCNQIFEKKSNYVKNYGILIRYDSRSDTHTMYKEYRDTTLTGAVEKMYAEMASRHRARKSSIQIVNAEVIKSSDAKRAGTLQFIDSGIKFPLPHRLPRASEKKYKTTFKFQRPNTHFL